MSDGLDLERLARVSASGTYANFVLSMAEAGIHIFMALYGFSVFCETPRNQRRGRRRYIVISFTIATLSSFSAALDNYWNFKCLLEASSPLEYPKMMAKYWRTWERLATLLSFAIVTFIGDALLVYRCFIMWRHRWHFTVLPILAYIASVVVGLATFSFYAADDKARIPVGMASAWIYLNVFTNVMVTFLVSYPLLKARRNLLQILSKKDLDMYTGIVAMLIESALPLSVFGTVFAGLLVSTPKRTTEAMAQYDIAKNVLSFLYYAFAALAPHMIIFRITTNKTWVNSAPYESSTAIHSEPIQFAPPTSDTYARSRRSSTLDQTKTMELSPIGDL